MCVIIYIPQNETITREELKEAWTINPHGGGYAYNDGETVTYERGIMNFNKYYQKIKKLIGKVNLLLHMRITTTGTINQTQTHPYDPDHLTRLKDNTKNPISCMNGTIRDIKTINKLNDTQTYIKKHKDTFKKHITPHTINLISKDTESKWATITPNNIILSKEFIQYNNKYYSNTHHLEILDWAHPTSQYINWWVDERIISELNPRQRELLEDYIYFNCFHDCRDCQYCLSMCKSKKEVLNIISSYDVLK